MSERPPAILGQCNYPPLLERAGRSVTCPPIMDKAGRQQDNCHNCRKFTIGRLVRSDFLSPAEKTGESGANDIRESSMARTNWSKNKSR